MNVEGQKDEEQDWITFMDEGSSQRTDSDDVLNPKRMLLVASWVQRPRQQTGQAIRACAGHETKHGREGRMKTL